MATGRLHGKVALITGSDSGIGQAAATEFAREGADVVVHYLHDAEGAAQTRKGVEAAGRRAVVIQADISVEEQVESMFDEAVQAFGTLDVLVNNAGVDASGKPVAELPTEVWDRALRTKRLRHLLLLPSFRPVTHGLGRPGTDHQCDVGT